MTKFSKANRCALCNGSNGAGNPETNSHFLCEARKSYDLPIVNLDLQCRETFYFANMGEYSVAYTQLGELYLEYRKELLK